MSAYEHETGMTREEIVGLVRDAIKRDDPTFDVVSEAIDTIAMCFRYLETGDRYRTPAPYGTAAERLIELVKIASDQGWLHPECTGGDCRLAQLRLGLIEYLGAVPSLGTPRPDPLAHCMWCKEVFAQSAMPAHVAEKHSSDEWRK